MAFELQLALRSPVRSKYGIFGSGKMSRRRQSIKLLHSIMYCTLYRVLKRGLMLSTVASFFPDITLNSEEAKRNFGPGDHETSYCLHEKISAVHLSWVVSGERRNQWFAERLR